MHSSSVCRHSFIMSTVAVNLNKNALLHWLMSGIYLNFHLNFPLGGDGILLG